MLIINEEYSKNKIYSGCNNPRPTLLAYEKCLIVKQGWIMFK